MPELRFTVHELPGRALSPNGSHGTHHGVAAARREYRAVVAALALNAVRAHSQPFPVEYGLVSVTAVFTTKQAHDKCYRPKDVPNLIYALKPLYDGLVDAGVLVGDQHDQMEIGPHRIYFEGIPPSMEEVRVRVYGVSA